MSKIAIIVPSADENVLNLKKQACATFAKVGTTVQIVGVPNAPERMDSHYAVDSIGPQILETIKILQTRGTEAIILDNIRDPLLSAARQLVNIPVLGAGQSVFHIACLLADNFSVITTSRNDFLAIKTNLRKYMLLEKLASLRTIGPKAHGGNPQALKELFTQAATRAIQEDDAHALIIDSGGVHGIAADVQQELKDSGLVVPVLDSTLVALKLGEVLTDMNLSHSKRSYPTPPATISPGYSYQEPIFLEEATGLFQLEAKLRVVVPSSEMGVEEVSKETYSVYPQPAVVVDAVNLERGPHSVESNFDIAVGAPQICQRAIQAEEEGIDAMIIDCMADLGIQGSREMVRMLMVGAGMISMHIASILADKFSVITVLDQSIPEFERQIRRYGLWEQTASVRAVEIHVLELAEQTERLLNDFADESIKAIMEDDTHFIVPGCTGMVGLYKRVQSAVEKYDVPVIDHNGIIVKICELLLSLGLSHSKRSYPKPNN